MIDVHVLMPTSLPVHESRGASSRLVRDDDMSGSVHGASSSGAGHFKISDDTVSVHGAASSRSVTICQCTR